MSNNIAQEFTLAKIVNNDENKDYFFEIPPYQRLYEWGENEISELLDDMKKAFDEKKDKKYFIGTITTSQENNTSIEKDKKFVLIDGQQRLTTLWFVGFYLASRGCKMWQHFIFAEPKNYKNNKQDKILRISMPIRDNEENALRKLAIKIQKNEIKPSENGELNLCKHLPNDIHEKINEAFNYIEKWFNINFGQYENNQSKIDFKKLKCFSLFIYIRICFVFVELAQGTDLNRFFVRMNNRGKQLEKHEILKARMLNAIRESDKDNESKKDEWQKYAKIWDLCSDMDKYIFQSASDRGILESSNENGEKCNIDEIIKNFKPTSKNDKSNDDTPSKVKSIVDFSTFLLHCYKLWVAKKCGENEIPKAITITQDKLLEIMWENKNNKTYEITFKNNGQCCKEFIKYMLYYRVLFDYFVIKNNEKLGDKGKNPYTIKRLDKDSNGYYNVAESNVFENLAMIQNYLRVARQGEKQNYHHWLTPFLKFLDTKETSKEIWRTIKCNFTEISKIVEYFNNKSLCEKEYERDLVAFLENLDRKLAVGQLRKIKKNNLLDITNKIISNIDEHLNFKIEQKMVKKISSLHKSKQDLFFQKECFLNMGTNTPHYWFYRLEYYLWKWGKYAPEKFTSFKETESKIYNTELGEGKDKIAFKDIFAKNLFYFRLLGSIEHFSAVNRQPQRTDNSWDIDIFGNLALISSNLNSSLSNQIEKHKKDEIINQLKRNRIESLKYFIMCANLKSDEWTYENAKSHQNQMLEILIHSLNVNKAE